MSYTSPILQQLPTDEFVDVHFNDHVDSTLLGWKEPDQEVVRKNRMFSRRYSGVVYTRDEVKQKIREKDEADAWTYGRIGHRFRQREGSCVYNMLANAQQVKFCTQFGDEWTIPFSPNSGYIHNSRGPNSGSYVGGAIKWSESVGLLPSADYPGNVQRVTNGQFDCVFGETGNYYTRFPDNWEQTARLFRADEWEWVGTVEEWWSAILQDDPCGGGRDGHAVCHLFLALDGDDIYSGYVNSWGSWGMTLETAIGPLQSFGLDSERKVRTMVSRDGFRLRTMHAPRFVLEA